MDPHRRPASVESSAFSSAAASAAPSAASSRPSTAVRSEGSRAAAARLSALEAELAMARAERQALEARVAEATAACA
jgi:hypothetical protein